MVATGQRRVALVDERHDLVAQVVQVAAGAARVEELRAAARRPRVDEHDHRVRALAGREHRVEALDHRRLERGAAEPHVDLPAVALDHVHRRDARPFDPTPGERYTYSGRRAGSPSGLPASSSDSTTSWSSVPASGRSQGAPGAPSTSRSATARDRTRNPPRLGGSRPEGIVTLRTVELPDIRRALAHDGSSTRSPALTAPERTSTRPRRASGSRRSTPSSRTTAPTARASS